jgi:hypothetical protein
VSSIMFSSIAIVSHPVKSFNKLARDISSSHTCGHNRSCHILQSEQ